jgi:hypothetical protein
MVAPTKWLRVAFLAVITSLSSNCQEEKGATRPGFSNPDFQFWCGDQACAWEVEAGEVEQVSTWHRKVYGIGLISNGAAIS